MKKFIFLLSVLMVLLIALPASANIGRETDEFDGHVSIHSAIAEYNSTVDIKPFMSLILFKTLPGDSSCLLSFGRVESISWWFFADNSRVKIDGEIYNLEMKTDSKMDSSGDLYTHGSCWLEGDLLSAFKAAKEVVFEVKYKNKAATIWKVPDEVLKEWQTVMNTAK